MRKFVVSAAGVMCVLAFGTSGTASAACSQANGPNGYDSSGGTVVSAGGGELFVLGTSYDVGGQLNGVGYGEADPDVGTGGVSYNGTLSGAVGYGDLQGTVSTGGVSGSADGEVAGGLASASGSLSGTTLAVQGTVAGVCLP